MNNYTQKTLFGNNLTLPSTTFILSSKSYTPVPHVSHPLPAVPSFSMSAEHDGIAAVEYGRPHDSLPGWVRIGTLTHTEKCVPFPWVCGQACVHLCACMCLCCSGTVPLPTERKHMRTLPPPSLSLSVPPALQHCTSPLTPSTLFLFLKVQGWNDALENQSRKTQVSNMLSAPYPVCKIII